VSEESEAELRRRKNGYNPVELNSRLNEAVERLLNISREKDNVKQTFREGAGQAEAV
jgi:transcriptional/translational regulatory protein YebC/TACO1